MEIKRLAVIMDTADSEFVKRAVKGMAEAALSKGWQLDYVEAGRLSYPGRHALLKQIIRDKKAGAAAYVHLLLTDDQAEHFLAAQMPLGFLAGSLPRVDSVTADETEGARLATAHLIKLGHKKIALLNGPSEIQESRERAEGYKKALADAKLGFEPALLVNLRGYSPEAGYDGALPLLSKFDRPSALFVAAGDLAAQGALKAARERNLRVPAQLSVVGYDDLPLAESSDPPLSSVRQPLEAMAKKLAEALFDAAEHPKLHYPVHEKIKPELKPRLSSAALKA